MSDNPEQGATGRRFVVSIAFVVFGAALLLYGLIAQQWVPFGAGVLFTVIFGLTAAGMKRGEASVGPLKVKTDFTASPLPVASEAAATEDEPTQAP